ncbi:MAG: hypothetical protein MN733_14770, partial [Nitrososphaera sp.]|nr:hypothetical protein [Nitrososphaera sp.]
IRDHGVIRHLAQTGQRLSGGLNNIVSQLDMDYVALTGYPFRTQLNFSPAAGDPLAMKTLVQQELIRRGIIWSGIHNLCYSHGSADIDYTLAAYAAVLPILKQAVEAKDIASRLKGHLLQPVFRKTSHFDTKPNRPSQEG